MNGRQWKSANWKFAGWLKKKPRQSIVPILNQFCIRAKVGTKETRNESKPIYSANRSNHRDNKLKFIIVYLSTCAWLQQVENLIKPTAPIAGLGAKRDLTLDVNKPVQAVVLCLTFFICGTNFYALPATRASGHKIVGHYHFWRCRRRSWMTWVSRARVQVVWHVELWRVAWIDWFAFEFCDV